MIDKKLMQIIERSNQNTLTKSDRKEFRNYLSEHPQISEEIGDLSTSVRERTLNCISNEILIETTRRSLSNMRKEFGYDTTTTLERLLIENILNCWLQYHLVESHYSTFMSGSVSLKQGQYMERRLTASQRRYLRSIETLAKVRKMKLPAIQINVAGQQINSL